jgi:hypothetical protein
VSLQAGVRLGPYEILSALGAGGMGEVYRARDRKLDRDVAIKVLPAFKGSTLRLGQMADACVYFGTSADSDPNTPRR